MQHLTPNQLTFIIVATLLMGIAIGVFFTSWWYTRPRKHEPKIHPIYKGNSKQQVYTFEETSIYNN